MAPARETQSKREIRLLRALPHKGVGLKGVGGGGGERMSGVSYMAYMGCLPKF
jgi:hypothetical protein